MKAAVSEENKKKSAAKLETLQQEAEEEEQKVKPSYSFTKPVVPVKDGVTEKVLEVEAKEDDKIIPKGIVAFSEEPTDDTGLNPTKASSSHKTVGPKGEGLKILKVDDELDDDYGADENKGEEDGLTYEYRKNIQELTGRKHKKHTAGTQHRMTLKELEQKVKETDPTN